MVEGAVSKGPQAIVLRLIGLARQFKQRQKRLLQNIFGLSVAQAQGAPVKNQPGRFGFIKRLAPITVELGRAHATA